MMMMSDVSVSVSQMSHSDVSLQCLSVSNEQKIK